MRGVCIYPMCCAEGLHGPEHPMPKPNKGGCQRLPCDLIGALVVSPTHMWDLGL